MEELLKTRQLLIQSKLLREKNYDMFDMLIESENADLMDVAKICQVFYNFVLDWQASDKYFEIVKDEYDAVIFEKYNIDIDNELLKLFKDENKLQKDAMQQINYYTYLNKCYSKELSQKTK